MLDHSPRAEFLGGVRAELPLLLGVMPFGLIFGVLGLAAGLPAWAALLALLVARLTRSVLATIAAGMAAVWVAQAWLV